MSLTLGIPCFFANASARVRSLAATACKTTSGCDFAGRVSDRGLFNVNSILKMPPSGTYAVVAVPKMPNLTALLFFSGVGGTKDVYTRINRDIMLLFIVFE